MGSGQGGVPTKIDFATGRKPAQYPFIGLQMPKGTGHMNSSETVGKFLKVTVNTPFFSVQFQNNYIDPLQIHF